MSENERERKASFFSSRARACDLKEKNEKYFFKSILACLGLKIAVLVFKDDYY